MSFFSWLRSRTSVRSPRGRAQHRPAAPRFRPRLEALEDRWLPSMLTVTNNLDDGSAGSLRADIAAANSGDTIQFAPSLSGQTIRLLNSELVIKKNLTIQGPSAPNTPVTISGGLLTRIFEVDGANTNVALSNLNLIDGGGLALNAASAGAINGQGGAIWNGGTLTITACNLNHNVNSVAYTTDSYGGAIYNAGTLTVQNCVLDNNSAGPTVVAGGTGFEPIGPGQGGAIYNAGMLTVSNSTLDHNLVTGFPARGAGIANAYKASATITNSTLSGNTDALQGGALYNQGTMTLSGCTVSGNFAVMSAYNYPAEGGGIYNGYDGILTILNSDVTGNSPNDVYNLGTFLHHDSKIGSVVKG
jgi:hypothetical protein